MEAVEEKTVPQSVVDNHPPKDKEEADAVVSVLPSALAKFLPTLPRDIWIYVMSFLSREDAINLTVAFSKHLPNHLFIRNAIAVKVFEKNTEEKSSEYIVNLREYCRDLVAKPRKEYLPTLGYILEKLSASVVDRKLIENAELQDDQILRDRLNNVMAESLRMHRKLNMFFTDISRKGAHFKMDYEKLIQDLSVVVTSKSNFQLLRKERGLKLMGNNKELLDMSALILTIIGVILLATGLLLWGPAGDARSGKILMGVGTLCLLAGALVMVNQCTGDRLRINAVKAVKNCWGSFFKSATPTPTPTERTLLLSNKYRNEDKIDKMERGELVPVTQGSGGP